MSLLYIITTSAYQRKNRQRIKGFADAGVSLVIAVVANLFGGYFGWLTEFYCSA